MIIVCKVLVAIRAGAFRPAWDKRARTGNEGDVADDDDVGGSLLFHKLLRVVP
jgi:hypothetical protein